MEVASHAQSPGNAQQPTVVVFGASGVLGSAAAESFREKGWKVLATGHKRKPAIEPSIQLDATAGSEMPRLEKWIREHASKVDAMVHCIGSTEDALISKMDDSKWQKTLDANLKSAFLVSKILIPILAKQRSGHLIFIGSWGGCVGRAGQTNYTAAKAGLIALTQSIAREYGSRGVVANCILPGIFRSPMTDAMSPEALEKLLDDGALKRFADLKETSEFIVHLASMKGVTGQVFQLDGRIGPSC
jgi:3-oxoacyl-[acyl-carrier protein] reductase